MRTVLRIVCEFHIGDPFFTPATQVVALERFAVIHLELLEGALFIAFSLPFTVESWLIVVSRPILGIIAFTVPLVAFH